MKRNRSIIKTCHLTGYTTLVVTFGKKKKKIRNDDNLRLGFVMESKLKKDNKVLIFPPNNKD